jgi:hypothetical protein
MAKDAVYAALANARRLHLRPLTYKTHENDDVEEEAPLRRRTLWGLLFMRVPQQAVATV